MKDIPKQNIYIAPQGYFENLPDRVVRRKERKNQRIMLTRIAAAAVLLVGMVLFIFKPYSISEANIQALYDQEVELYINSGFWEAEDVLHFSEDPNELLDVIISEEWSAYTLNGDPAADEYEF